MKRNIHKIYDLIMRIIIELYLPQFLKLLGEERKIVKVLNTEIASLSGKITRLDFLCLFEDGTLCNIEFQFPTADSDDLHRFFNYNIRTEVKYNQTTETIVVNFTTNNYGAKEIKIGDSKDFHPKMFYLGDIDFISEIEKTHIKLNLNHLEKLINPKTPNIQLSYEEELHILLMTLVPKYKNKKKILKCASKLLNNEKIFHKEKIGLIRSIIKLEIENFLCEDERFLIPGDEKMTDEENEFLKRIAHEVTKKFDDEERERILKEGIEEGKKEGIEEGKKEGIEEGKKEGIVEVAKNLKGKLPPEEIAKCTGLSLSTILLL